MRRVLVVGGLLIPIYKKREDKMNEPDTQEVAVTCPYCMKTRTANKIQWDEDQTFYEGNCSDCNVKLSLCVEEIDR